MPKLIKEEIRVMRVGQPEDGEMHEVGATLKWARQANVMVPKMRRPEEEGAGLVELQRVRSAHPCSNVTM